MIWGRSAPLTVRHRVNRLTWVIDQYDKKRRRFGDQLNQVHGDEKWFYLMHDGTVCRVFPRHERTESGEIQRVVHMPLGPGHTDKRIRFCDKILRKVLRYSFAESLSRGHTAIVHRRSITERKRIHVHCSFCTATWCRG